MKLFPWLVFVLAAAVWIAALSASSEGNVDWWVTHGTVKVRPHDPPPENRVSVVELFAARNEFEPFQIVLTARGGPREDLDIQVSDFVGPGGAVIAGSNASVYLQAYIDLERPSSSEGRRGEWPDALVPRIDRYAGERRRAFPFDLRSGRNQALWVDVYVPPDAAPGRYSAEATILGEGTVIRIPITLTVWDFMLPSTSSYRTAFGFSGPLVLQGHYDRYTSDDDLYELAHLYGKSALLHRITFYGGSMVPPGHSRSRDSVRIDWSDYDREVGPFLDGTVLAEGDPLPGARATSVDLRVLQGLDGEESVLYWRAWMEHFEKRGWADRLYRYLWDEPMTMHYPEVVERGRLSRLADPRIRNLVTEQLASPLAEVVDIWTPLINCVDDRPGVASFCEETLPVSAYSREVAGGKELWWYQSCASHGCGIVGGPYFRGWPSYVIDREAMANRIMPWLSWHYGFQGELYFATNQAYGGRGGDPWEDVYRFGGNGDGTLFYPGRPDRIGGDTHIPVESLRLKLIREGLEDYEYLVMLAARGRSDFVRERVGEMLRTTYEWEKDPEVLYRIKRELGEELSRAR